MRALLVTLLFALIIPIALGPATTEVTRWLGGEPEHTCACGMKRGTCGCLECARLEAQRKADQRSVAYATARSTCEDDDGMVRAPQLPLVAPPPDAFAVVDAPSEKVLDAPVSPLQSEPNQEPITPPPRA